MKTLDIAQEMASVNRDLRLLLWIKWARLSLEQGQDLETILDQLFIKLTNGGY